MIDFLLSQVDVSTARPQPRAERQGRCAGSRTPPSAIANTLAETYLDFQRKDKVATLDRVDKFLMGRVAELREQVKKSDQAVEDYRRKHGLYKGTGATAA